MIYKGLRIRQHLPFEVMLLVIEFSEYTREEIKSLKKGNYWNNLKVKLRILKHQGEIVKLLTYKDRFAWRHSEKVIDIIKRINWYSDKAKGEDQDIKKNINDICCTIAANHAGILPYDVKTKMSLDEVSEFMKQKLTIKLQDLTFQLFSSCAPNSKEALKAANKVLDSLRKRVRGYKDERIEKPKEKKFINIQSIIPRVKRV